MLALMHLRDLHESDQDFGDGREDHEVETYNVQSAFWPRFSDELRNLVTWCLKRDPDDRPTPEELYERIQAQQDSNPALNNARNGFLPAIPAELMTGQEDAIYKFGFCRLPEPMGPLLRLMNPDPVDSPMR